jgi:GTPase SAR1 family protein
VKETSPPVNDDEKYMKEALSEGKKEWRRSKIMIVGEGRAGKTALANSILGRAYENFDSTIGINEFTCSIGYANVGEGKAANGLDEKNWKELKDQKKLKELEGALASMIFDQKTNKIKNYHNKKMTAEDVDGMIKRLKGGYLEGETHGITEMRHELNTGNEAVATGRLPALNSVRNRNEQGLNGLTEKKDIQRQGSFSHDSQTRGKVEDNHSVIPPSSEIDTSLVMRYLGEQSKIESKFIISVFDFGGQSVFNVIHPFFLTSFGVYVITFNMEWLCSSADSAIRED